MKRLIPILLVAAAPLFAQGQQYKIAIIGLVHSHVWGHLGKVAKGQTPAKLVGIAEPHKDLQEEAQKVTGPSVPFYTDYKEMLDKEKPDIVWAFVENNRHLEIVQACAPRKIQVMFEKPLASTFKDALAIRSLADKDGIRIMTNYQMAWWPANYAAKAQVDSGKLGAAWRLHGIVGHGGPSGPGWDSVRNKYFREWLTDPVGNGAGALMDFGCYNALWSLWYFGKPETVYAQANHLQPELYPKVEDNADLVLHYKNGVGIFEGSWDLPRSYQDLEVLGRTGSVYMTERKVSVRARGMREPQDVTLEPLPADRAEPVAYMVSCIRDNKPLEGLVALPINVDVVEIIEAAKQSIATGRAVPLPLAKGKK